MSNQGDRDRIVALETEMENMKDAMREFKSDTSEIKRDVKRLMWMAGICVGIMITLKFIFKN